MVSQAPSRANYVAIQSASTNSGLLSMPPEILDKIASYVACSNPSGIISSPLSSPTPSSGFLYDVQVKPCSVTTPPSDMLSLLLVCKRFYNMLRPETNSRLYATIFRNKFDTAAIARRFGPSALSSSMLAVELKRRCIILKRMRQSVMVGQLKVDETDPNADQMVVDNLWLVYLMTLENDGLNLEQLKWAQIHSYLALHHAQEMLGGAVRPGYPLDTPDRALALHLTYLLTDPEDLTHESREESDERLFVLRPFVFAAHKFDAFHAPWTIRNLPLSQYKNKTASNGSRNEQHPNRNPFLADLTPRPRFCFVEHCGRRIKLAVPILSQGACFSFFMKVEKDPAVLGMRLLRELDQEGLSLDSLLSSANASPIIQAGTSMNPLSLTSFDHDKDFARLLCCLDPITSLGLPPLFCAGMFEGTWEGRFSFFDFDSYREMLAGRTRSLYEGPFGEQPQIWKIKEKIVRLPPDELEGGTGSILTAGYTSRGEDALVNDVTTTNPSASTATSTASTTTTTTAAVPLPVENPNGKGKGKADSGSESGSIEARQDSLPCDWNVYPYFDDESSYRRKTMGQDRYEILLSGTGHSAWGRFVLRGRVRSWDGMLIMNKEYRPDGRGKWLYRGYSVAGGRLVGRWRDTFTPENMSGYEGCFLLHRRESQ